MPTVLLPQVTSWRLLKLKDQVAKRYRRSSTPSRFRRPGSSQSAPAKYLVNRKSEPEIWWLDISPDSEAIGFLLQVSQELHVSVLELGCWCCCRVPLQECCLRFEVCCFRGAGAAAPLPGVAVRVLFGCHCRVPLQGAAAGWWCRSAARKKKICAAHYTFFLSGVYAGVIVGMISFEQLLWPKQFHGLMTQHHTSHPTMCRVFAALLHSAAPAMFPSVGISLKDRIYQSQLGRLWTCRNNAGLVNDTKTILYVKCNMLFLIHAFVWYRKMNSM